MPVVLLGLALAVLGPAAYFGLTWLAALPRTLVEHPWPFEALSIAGFLVAAFGSVGALRAHRRVKRSVTVTFLTVLGAVAMLGYIHWLSSRLPDPPAAFVAGHTVPPLDLPTTDGGRVTLETLRGKPAVLIFFRGHWCAFCRTELSELAKEVEHIRAAGGDVVAISTSSLDQSRALVDTLGLTFVLASDPDMAVIKAWGLVDPMVGTYARPAAIVLDREGRVHKAWFPDDWRVAVPPAEIVAAVTDSAR